LRNGCSVNLSRERKRLRDRSRNGASEQAMGVAEPGQGRAQIDRSAVGDAQSQPQQPVLPTGEPADLLVLHAASQGGPPARPKASI
jgi:hypothetical protein